jgi:hypothetical protein
MAVLFQQSVLLSQLDCNLQFAGALCRDIDLVLPYLAGIAKAEQPDSCYLRIQLWSQFPGFLKD